MQASLSQEMTEVEILRSRNSFVALPRAERERPKNKGHIRSVMMSNEDEPELVVDLEPEQQTQSMQSNGSSMIENEIQQSGATEDEEDECPLDAIHVEEIQAIGQSESDGNQGEQIELANSSSPDKTFNANDSGLEGGISLNFFSCLFLQKMYYYCNEFSFFSA